MHFIVIRKEILERKDIQLHTKFVLSLIECLSMRMKTSTLKWVFPTNDYISKKIQTPLRTVQRSIAELIEKKLVEVRYKSLNQKKDSIVKKRYLRPVEFSLVIRSGEVIKFSHSNHKSEVKKHSDFSTAGQAPIVYSIFTSVKIMRNLKKNKFRSVPIKKDKQKNNEVITLSIRRQKPEVKYIINKWNSYGFSKPSNKSLPKLERSISLLLRKKNKFQIVQVFNIASGYINSTDFKYHPKPTSLTTFIDSIYPVNGVEKVHFESELPSKAKLTWFNIFYLKDEKWLDKNILHEFNSKVKDEYYKLLLTNTPVGLFGRVEERKIIQGARHLKAYVDKVYSEEYRKANPLFLRAVESDYKSFLERRYHSGVGDKFKLYFLNTGFFWEDFAKFRTEARGKTYYNLES